MKQVHKLRTILQQENYFIYRLQPCIYFLTQLPFPACCQIGGKSSPAKRCLLNKFENKYFSAQNTSFINPPPQHISRTTTNMVLNLLLLLILLLAYYHFHYMWSCCMIYRTKCTCIFKRKGIANELWQCSMNKINMIKYE